MRGWICHACTVIPVHGIWWLGKWILLHLPSMPGMGLSRRAWLLPSAACPSSTETATTPLHPRSSTGSAPPRALCGSVAHIQLCLLFCTTPLVLDFCILENEAGWDSARSPVVVQFQTPNVCDQAEILYNCYYCMRGKSSRHEDMRKERRSCLG